VRGPSGEGMLAEFLSDSVLPRPGRRKIFLYVEGAWRKMGGELLRKRDKGAPLISMCVGNFAKG